MGCILGVVNRRRQRRLVAASAGRRLELCRAAGKAEFGGSSVFQVPERWRRDGPETPQIDWLAPEEPASFAYYGLDQLFPDVPQLGAAFNGNAGFRRHVREVMRCDLFRPVPKLTAEVNSELRELFIDLTKPHVKAPLTEAEEDGQRKMRPLPQLTEVFAAHSLPLAGEAFVQRLLALGGLAESGQFSDLVGKPHEGHRWHQDHGDDRYTVMLGFPPEDNFQGVGVFSHVVRLSHPLRRPETSQGWVAGTPIVVRIPEPKECLLRPLYRPGQEVLVYRDSACLHSTPDAVHREALWRFM